LSLAACLIFPTANAALIKQSRGHGMGARAPSDPACIAEGEGKVVKVISRLLLSLPDNHDYRIIFMQRPLPEVLASQDEMLRRRGTYKEGADPAVISAAFEKHLREVYAWLDSKPHVKNLRVAYHVR
jgi:hypothetical protein